MKARIFKIVIAAEFEDEVDERIVSDGIMKALQCEAVPRGRAQVLSQAIPTEVVRLTRAQLDTLN